MPTDPRFERALEEFFASERFSRRRFVGRAGSTGLALAGLSTAAVGLRVDRGHRGPGRGEEVRAGRGQPPQDRDRRLDVLQLAALHRQEGHQGLQQEVRRQVQVRRGDQRQQRVLRQDPPAARAGPADRPRHHHADRLPGLAARPAQLRRAAGQEQHPEPGQHGQQPADHQLRPGALVHDALAVRGDRGRLQHQEDRARAQERQGPLRPEVQGPRDDALRALRLRQHGAARRRRRRLPGQDRRDPRRRSRRSTRPTAAASSAASPATTTRPTSPRATCGSRSPTRAT